MNSGLLRLEIRGEGKESEEQAKRKTGRGEPGIGKFWRMAGRWLGGMPVAVLHSALWSSDNMLYLPLYHVLRRYFKGFSAVNLPQNGKPEGNSPHLKVAATKSKSTDEKIGGHGEAYGYHQVADVLGVHFLGVVGAAVAADQAAY